MQQVIFYSLVFFALSWWGLSLYISYSLLRIPRFEKLAVDTGTKLPRLSIIIVACNEETHLASALSTLQQQAYPDLEIIMVNDRSTDETGNIMQSFAQQDPRFRMVEVKQLADGWLGKINAQQQGLQQATGEWILFTDADVHFDATLLQRAVAWSEQQQLDHLVLMPDVHTRNFLLEICIRTFGLMFLVSTRAVSVNRENSKAFIGVGAFNLVRKAFFDKTEGLQWLKMEVADDAGLGLMVKNNHGKQFFAMAGKDIWLDWYPDVPSMFRGLEKNLFAGGAHYRLSIMFVQVLLTGLLALTPFIGPLYAWLDLNQVNTAWISLASYTSLFVLLAVTLAQRDAGGWKVLFMPVGLFIIALMLLNSGYRCWRQGGILWRGTLYPLRELRQQQRVRL